MKKAYDFSKALKNPYAKRLKRPVTIRLDEPTIGYFKRLAGDTGIHYQTLINLYLRDCALQERKPDLSWLKSKSMRSMRGFLKGIDTSVPRGPDRV